MQILKKENGFTLMEMLIVLGVLTIFLTVITNILLVSASISQKFDTNLNAKTATNIAYSHIETMVKMNDSYDDTHGEAIQIITDTSSTPSTTQLRIVTDIKNDGGDILHYYFDSSKNKLYFTASADTHKNVIKDEKTSMVLIDNVQNITFSIGGTDNTTLIVTISTYIDKDATDLNHPKNLNTTTRNIFLKATS